MEEPGDGEVAMGAGRGRGSRKEEEAVGLGQQSRMAGRKDDYLGRAESGTKGGSKSTMEAPDGRYVEVGEWGGGPEPSRVNSRWE